MIRNKKGQAFALADFWSIFVIMFLFFVFYILMSLPSCTRDSAEKDIKENTENINIVRLQTELNSMLMAKVPDDIVERVADLEGKTTIISSKYQLDSRKISDDDIEKTLEILGSDEGIYMEQTYSEFVMNLFFEISDDKDANRVFKIVTIAMFGYSAEFRDTVQIVHPFLSAKYQDRELIMNADITKVAFTQSLPTPDHENIEMSIHYIGGDIR